MAKSLLVEQITDPRKIKADDLVGLCWFEGSGPARKVTSRMIGNVKTAAHKPTRPTEGASPGDPIFKLTVSAVRGVPPIKVGGNGRAAVSLAHLGMHLIGVSEPVPDSRAKLFFIRNAEEGKAEETMQAFEQIPVS